jgi:DNA invertase Pin-like site-specific DNA recombinase
MTASRIAGARAAMMRQGKRLAGPPPFVYSADARTRQLKQVLAEANQVRAIFKMAATGMRPSAVAETTDARG